MNAPPAPPQVSASITQAGSRGDLWRLYAYLQERARAAGSLAELQFSLANEPWQLLSYRQGYVFSLASGKPRLVTVSGLASLGEDSPFTIWLKRLGRWIAKRMRADRDNDPQIVSVDDLPGVLVDGWREWLPEYLLVEPVLAPGDERMLGFAAYAIDDVPGEVVQMLMMRTMGAYGHAWAALAPPPRRVGWRRWAGLGVLAMAVAAMFIPVRLSVLAPAEIIGLDAAAISAPMDGVVAVFHVQPNERVTKGDKLFTLDATSLNSQREIALKQLQVARADALAAEQRAFGSESSRADLASLRGKVAQQEAELASVEAMLARIEVRAPRDGVAVFADVNDWQGKPVVTGERLALLADPDQPGVLIWMPVADAINLEAGAEVRLFLDVAPLSPLQASIIETSYQSSTSPAGVQAYRLRASLLGSPADSDAPVRIGLRGTAKVYGRTASLGYYVFRRPIAGLRAFLGL